MSEGRSPYPLVSKVILGQLNSLTDLRVIPLGIILSENHPVPYINLFLETRTKVNGLNELEIYPIDSPLYVSPMYLNTWSSDSGAVWVVIELFGCRTSLEGIHHCCWF